MINFLQGMMMMMNVNCETHKSFGKLNLRNIAGIMGGGIWHILFKTVPIIHMCVFYIFLFYFCVCE